MAAALAALALAVTNQGEDPELAAAALQLSATTPGLHWPGREAALGRCALLTLTKVVVRGAEPLL